jgi:nucleoid-associated protein YgaU
VVKFRWAETEFIGVVTDYSEQFTLFNEEGKIQRARIVLKLKNHTPPDEQTHAQDPHSPDRTKTRPVKAGERLDMIAAEEYGDPSFWPVLARANGIARPRVLTPGLLLLVPPLT